jgi:hypothetical protein
MLTEELLVLGLRYKNMACRAAIDVHFPKQVARLVADYVNVDACLLGTLFTLPMGAGRYQIKFELPRSTSRSELILTLPRADQGSGHGLSMSMFVHGWWSDAGRFDHIDIFSMAIGEGPPSILTAIERCVPDILLPLGLSSSDILYLAMDALFAALVDKTVCTCPR